MADKERQTGEQLHTMGGFPLRLYGLAEISLTATASQSLLGLYWVRAIAKDQVANELQAVHFWEGHAHSYAHTLSAYIHIHKQSPTLVHFWKGGNLWFDLAPPALCAHQNISETLWERWKWGPTRVDLAERRQPCWMILPNSFVWLN